jgi:hypothetical protein
MKVLFSLLVFAGLGFAQDCLDPGEKSITPPIVRPVLIGGKCMAEDYVPGFTPSVYPWNGTYAQTTVNGATVIGAGSMYTVCYGYCSNGFAPYSGINVSWICAGPAYGAAISTLYGSVASSSGDLSTLLGGAVSGYNQAFCSGPPVNTGSIVIPRC